MSIVSRLINRPESFSIEMLRQGVQSGTIPAYIGIPLIQEKLKDKQEMENAAAPKGPMPPVADQVMAQAAQATQPQPQLQPQPQQPAPGLMGLRSNLPAKFAGGGIVAFADGGDVERYQNRGLVSPDNMTQEERDRRAMLDTLRKLGAAGMDIGTLPIRGIAGAAESVITRPLRAMGVQVPYLPESFYGGNRSSMTPYMDKLRAEGIVGTPVEATPTSPAAAPAPAPAAPAPAAPSGQGLGGESALGRTPGMGLQPSAFSAPPYIRSASDIFGQQVYGTETEPGFLAKATALEAERDKKIAEAKGKVTGKAYEGLEADLRKEAQEMGADKEQAKYMAMFKAGLAMMSGTSRFASENIGKGALVGAEDYQRAAADIKKAQRENRRMMAQIEQARRAEDRGDRDQEIARLDKAFDAKQARDQFLLTGFTNAGIKDADRKLEEWKTMFGGEKALQAAHVSGQYQLRAAEARANRPAGITPYQLAMLRDKAAKNVDVDAVRSEVAQSLKLSKTPKPGQDAAFDKRVQELYSRRIDDYAAQLLGGSTGAGAQSFGGFKLLGPEN